MSDTHKRQLDILNPAEYAEQRVVIIGLGNIGSHAALALARMGVRRFALYDFDTVEVHNLASQAYTLADVGTVKLDAIERTMRAVAEDIEVVKHPVAYQVAHREGSGVIDGDIVVIAVDSLETRRAIADAISCTDARIIDGRMGGGQVEVHTCHASEYAGIIPSEADTDACAARYISYTSLIIAGAITNTTKRMLREQNVPSSLLLHCDTWEILKG
jgi:molybdopterin/thiamine biosynthesis adenylyltransferase